MVRAARLTSRLQVAAPPQDQAAPVLLRVRGTGAANADGRPHRRICPRPGSAVTASLLAALACHMLEMRRNWR